MSAIEHQAPSPARRPTLLLVDDEPSNLLVLNALLAPHYELLAATSGERGLKLADSMTPDLILLDVMMPEMDGFEVIHRLKSDERTAGIPVIFVTAMDQAVDVVRGLGLGAVDYVGKPIEPLVLLARVKTHLELKQARDGLAQQNVWLEREVAKRLAEVALIQDVSLSALAEVVETRDQDTGHHIRRTQAYMAVLTQAMAGMDGVALSERIMSHFVKAAPLHDIGKVGVPDQILLKPGKLDEQEWIVMQRHTEIGARAIGQALQRAQQAHRNLGDDYASHAIEFLRVAQDIALNHHERWDGSGYPAGRKGEDIPLSARLMAVADVFDALTTSRSYKPPMPVQEARAWIVAGSGSQFDPTVVACFEQHFDELVSIAESQRDGP